MRKRAPNETCEPYRRRVHEKQGHALRDRLAKWADTVREQLSEAWPEMAFTRPKTKMSQNPVPIPPPFLPYLLEHKAKQEELRQAAGELWEECDALFTRADGRPLDPRADWAEFKELLDEAGISDHRQHDESRHTAGTILNELGVDMPTIMEILRHTQISQTRRYVKGRSELSREAMRWMGEAFMPAPAPGPARAPVPGPGPLSETRTETESTRAARARRRRKIR